MEDFFKRIDDALSNVGMDKVWKQKICGSSYWFGPIRQKDYAILNEKVVEATNADTLSAAENLKKLFLSYSIVGINNDDLRPYREERVFKLDTGHKSNLQMYMYEKISRWDYQTVDDMYKVYLDITKMIQFENLKDIKWYEVSDPILELKDLESKVNDLREKIGIEKIKTFDEIQAEKLENSNTNEEQQYEFSPPVVKEQPPVEQVVNPRTIEMEEDSKLFDEVDKKQKKNRFTPKK